MNGARIGPGLQKGYHGSLPSSAPHTLQSHILCPQENHFTSLCSSCLLAKHILVNWQLLLSLEHSWENQSLGSVRYVRYHRQKLLQVAKIPWEYIWRNTNNCMNIHYKNMTLRGFLNIILRHHITWGAVFEWVMVITDCCKLKRCVICSLTE